MPRRLNGRMYLNGTEAIELLETSPVTFRDMRELYKLEGEQFKGLGQSKWYSLNDLIAVQKQRFGEDWQPQGPWEELLKQQQES